MNVGDETRARGGCRGGDGARGQLAEARGGRSDYASQTPRSLVRPSHRYHHPPPFYSLQPPRNSPTPAPPPRARFVVPPVPASPRHLVPPDPLRRPNNPIRLFSARVRAYTEVCNFGVGNARYRTGPRMRRVFVRESYEKAE